MRDVRQRDRRVQHRGGDGDAGASREQRVPGQRRPHAVRGSHQIGVGANVAYLAFAAADVGAWRRARGTSPADHGPGPGGPPSRARGGARTVGDAGGLTFYQWYKGVYIQDTWRATDRITINAGLRWEPFFGQNLIDGSVANFDRDKFLARHARARCSGVRRRASSTRAIRGSPGGTGLNKQWWNLSPRVGLAWDVLGDGRMAVRSSYGIVYDFPTGEFGSNLAAGAAVRQPLRVIDPPGRMDDPYAHLGGDPHPITMDRTPRYRSGSAPSASITPDINSPRVQSWNVSARTADRRRLGRVGQLSG